MLRVTPPHHRPPAAGRCDDESAGLAFAGDECLACLDEFHPKAILLDLDMPKVIGFGVARLLKSLPEHGAIPLIALPGYGQAADRQGTQEAGFGFHLPKPATVEQVENTP